MPFMQKPTKLTHFPPSGISQMVELELKPGFHILREVLSFVPYASHPSFGGHRDETNTVVQDRTGQGGAVAAVTSCFVMGMDRSSFNLCYQFL